MQTLPSKGGFLAYANFKSFSNSQSQEPSFGGQGGLHLGLNYFILLQLLILKY